MPVPLATRLADATLVALAADGALWPRPLLGFAPIPDAWMALVQMRDGRRRFVPAGEDPRTERGDRLLLVRNRLITVPLGLARGTADGGHEISASAELLVRWPPREPDLAALSDRLPHDGDLALDEIAQLCAGGGGLAALRDFAATHTAEVLLAADWRDEFLAAARTHLRRTLFEYGLTIERVAKLQFTSATLAHAQAAERESSRRRARLAAQAELEQAAAEATQRRLGDLRAMLDKLHDAADGQARGWRELLPALAPAERGRLLENLWRVTPNRNIARAIVVAGDTGCWQLDPHASQGPAQRIALDDSLGGLRSVRTAPERGLLLVGAARGVWTVDVESLAVAGRYEAPAATLPRTGFNAAAIAGDRLFATHSQLGAWTWALADPRDARPLLQPARGVPAAIRSAVAQGERVYITADDCVHEFAADGSPLRVFDSGGAPIMSIAVLDEMLFIGTADGRLLAARLDLPGADAGDELELLHHGPAPLESIVARRWSDLLEVIIPAGPAGVLAVYPDERIVTPLLQAPLALRRAWASDDCVVGLSERRDRLYIMTADSPLRTGAEVLLPRCCGGAVQDAWIVTAADEPARRRSDEATERPRQEQSDVASACRRRETASTEPEAPARASAQTELEAPARASARTEPEAPARASTPSEPHAPPAALPESEPPESAPAHPDPAREPGTAAPRIAPMPANAALPDSDRPASKSQISNLKSDAATPTADSLAPPDPQSEISNPQSPAPLAELETD